MELDVDLTFTLKLNRQEFLLVSKALRGALKPEELGKGRAFAEKYVTVAAAHKAKFGNSAG